ncbi:hypothetical protein GBA52_014033 [Prunus armeniaca]|nr:hypothetical protein GBA52_014033 [Prunus armeniaca]
MGLNKSMFRYADGTDKLLMLFGTLGSIGDGLQNPLMMYILSEVINSYGSANGGLTNADVDKFALRLFYVAIGVGLAAFVEGLCWTRTAERQTSRMRKEYLKSVLRQEVSFFDTQTAGSSTTYQVISIISSDANAVQVALCEKIPDCLTYMSTFFFCHIFAFRLSWRLTLAAMPLSIMFIAPGLIFGKILMGLVMKGIEAYGVAGGFAEQAISSVRTVYSYVAENQTLNRFSTSLQKVTKLGIKVGLVKGLLMGSMGIIYIGWGFQAWVGTYLVTQKGEDGGHVFVAGFNVLMGGLSILSALPNLTAITEALAATTRILEMIDRASKGRTTIIIAHRLSTIRTANLIVVLQAGKVAESGSHNELMQMKGEQGGEYFKMVQMQQMASQNEAADDYEKPRRRRSVTPSPISYRSTAPSPAFNPTAMSMSMGTPYSFSVQYDPDDESDDEDFKRPTYPPPSQWRLLKMNAPEWGQALLGCLGAIGSGAVQPINAYCVGSLISVYFLQDKSEIKSQSRVLSLVFLGIGVFNFFTNLLQHYNFAIMGEKLTTRVREQLLEKLMTFEIGWYDQDENTSAAICARLATEVNMVRSLVGDRMSLLVQAVFGATFAYAVGLVLTWRLALVMIAVQPIVIGSFYARSILMKSMGEKARKAQKQGSQLASEAVINHRTITAFSSQKRILGLFSTTLKGPKKESIKQSYVSGAGLFSSQFFNTAATALAYWYGGRLLVLEEITPKHLFQAFLILLFTAYIIAEAGSMTSDISKGNSAIQSVFAILDRKSEIDPDNKWGLEIKRRIKGRVEFRNWNG